MDRRKRAVIVLVLVAAGCLFLQGALAGVARAEVVQSKYGPTIYTWSDAVEHDDYYRGVLKPWKTVEKDEKEKGGWVVKVTNDWTPDEKADECVPQIAHKIEKVLAALSDRGISPEIYHDMEIYILPAYRLLYDSPGEKEALRGCYKKTERPRVYYAGLDNNLYVLLHEIGHYFAGDYLDALGYDWSKANPVARSYLLLKGIPFDEERLSKTEQLKLPWEQEVAEIWAEDFATWAGQVYLRSIGSARRLTGLDAKASSWFDRFAYSLSTKFVVAGEEVKAWPVLLTEENRFLVPLESEIIARLNKQPSQVPEGVPVIETYGAPMVPLRAYAEALGARVEWNGWTRTVTITPQEPAA